MADLQRIIEIVFQGTDATGNAVQTVTQGLDVVSKKALDVTGPLASATDFILKVDAALIAMGATMVGVAVNQAGKFQTATAEINTLIDASPEKYRALQEQILEFSRGSASSIQSVTDAVYSAISAGTEYGNSVSVVAQAEQLAVAGRGDLNETTTLLVSTLNAFGAEADEAARYSDILFQTVKQGQTTIPELGASLAQVTGVAVAAGLPFADLSAAVADLTAKGLPTSQAITAIKAALSNIIKPSKAASDAASQLGIEFGVGALEAEGFDGLLRKLAEATGGNVTEMGKFFGSVEGLNGVMQLSANGAATFTKRLEAIRNSTGSTAEAYAKMAQTFDATNQRLRNNIEATLIQIGGRLLDQYGETAKALGEVFKGVGDGVTAKQFDPVLDVLNAFGLTAEKTLEDIARNMEGALAIVKWDQFTDALTDLGGAVASLFEGVDFSTPEGLAKAIQRIVDSGEFLINVTKGIVDGLKPFVEQAANLLKTMVDLAPETETAGGELLGFGKGLNVLLGFLAPVTDGIGSIGVGMQALAASSIVKTLSGASAGFAAMAAPIAAAAAAIGGIVFAYSQLSEAVEDYNARTTAHDEATRSLTQTQERFEEALSAASQEIGLAIPDMETFNKLADEGTIVFDEATGTWRKATDAVKAHGDAQLLTSEEIAAAIELEKQYQIAVGEEAANITQANDALLLRNQQFKEEVKWTSEVVDGVTVYTQALGAKTTAQRTDTIATKAAAEESEKFRLELEKIASDERIKNIEARVTLETAELESATAITIASFESIDNTITSTGDLLSDLFSEFNKADSLRDKWTIEDQIKIENDLRKEAAELQSELTQEQIQYLRAKTEALAKGDALITIKGDGLEPELEAFMWRIIERVQVEASNEGAEFLLGLA